MQRKKGQEPRLRAAKFRAKKGKSSGGTGEETLSDVDKTQGTVASNIEARRNREDAKQGGKGKCAGKNGKSMRSEADEESFEEESSEEEDKGKWAAKIGRQKSGKITKEKGKGRYVRNKEHLNHCVAEKESDEEDESYGEEEESSEEKEKGKWAAKKGLQKSGREAKEKGKGKYAGKKEHVNHFVAEEESDEEEETSSEEEDKWVAKKGLQKSRKGTMEKGKGKFAGKKEHFYQDVMEEESDEEDESSEGEESSEEEEKAKEATKKWPQTSGKGAWEKEKREYARKKGTLNHYVREREPYGDEESPEEEEEEESPKEQKLLKEEKKSKWTAEKGQQKSGKNAWEKEKRKYAAKKGILSHYVGENESYEEGTPPDEQAQESPEEESRSFFWASKDKDQQKSDRASDFTTKSKRDCEYSSMKLASNQNGTEQESSEEQVEESPEKENRGFFWVSKGKSSRKSDRVPDLATKSKRDCECSGMKGTSSHCDAEKESPEKEENVWPEDENRGFFGAAKGKDQQKSEHGSDLASIGKGYDKYLRTKEKSKCEKAEEEEKRAWPEDENRGKGTLKSKGPQKSAWSSDSGANGEPDPTYLRIKGKPKRSEKEETQSENENRCKDAVINSKQSLAKLTSGKERYRSRESEEGEFDLVIRNAGSLDMRFSWLKTEGVLQSSVLVKAEDPRWPFIRKGDRVVAVNGRLMSSIRAETFKSMLTQRPLTLRFKRRIYHPRTLVATVEVDKLGFTLSPPPHCVVTGVVANSWADHQDIHVGEYLYSIEGMVYSELNLDEAAEVRSRRPLSIQIADIEAYDDNLSIYIEREEKLGVKFHPYPPGRVFVSQVFDGFLLDAHGITVGCELLYLNEVRACEMTQRNFLHAMRTWPLTLVFSSATVSSGNTLTYESDDSEDNEHDLRVPQRLAKLRQNVRSTPDGEYLKGPAQTGFVRRNNTEELQNKADSLPAGDYGNVVLLATEENLGFTCNMDDFYRGALKISKVAPKSWAGVKGVSTEWYLVKVDNRNITAYNETELAKTLQVVRPLVLLFVAPLQERKQARESFTAVPPPAPSRRKKRWLGGESTSRELTDEEKESTMPQDEAFTMLLKEGDDMPCLLRDGVVCEVWGAGAPPLGRKLVTLPNGALPDTSMRPITLTFRRNIAEVMLWDFPLQFRCDSSGVVTQSAADAIHIGDSLLRINSIPFPKCLNKLGQRPLRCTFERAIRRGEVLECTEESLGIAVAAKNRMIVVSEVVAGSWAARNKIAPGDEVVDIGRINTWGKPLIDVVPLFAERPLEICVRRTLGSIVAFLRKLGMGLPPIWARRLVNALLMEDILTVQDLLRVNVDRLDLPLGLSMELAAVLDACRVPKKGSVRQDKPQSLLPTKAIEQAKSRTEQTHHASALPVPTHPHRQSAELPPSPQAFPQTPEPIETETRVPSSSKPQPLASPLHRQVARKDTFARSPLGGEGEASESLSTLERHQLAALANGRFPADEDATIQLITHLGELAKEFTVLVDVDVRSLGMNARMVLGRLFVSLEPEVGTWAQSVGLHLFDELFAVDGFPPTAQVLANVRPLRITARRYRLGKPMTRTARPAMQTPSIDTPRSGGAAHIDIFSPDLREVRRHSHSPRILSDPTQIATSMAEGGKLEKSSSLSGECKPTPPTPVLWQTTKLAQRDIAKTREKTAQGEVAQYFGGLWSVFGGDTAPTPQTVKKVNYLPQSEKQVRGGPTTASAQASPRAKESRSGQWAAFSPWAEEPPSAPESALEAAAQLPAEERVANRAEGQSSKDSENRSTKSFSPQVKGPLPTPTSAHAPDSVIARPAAQGGWGIWDMLSPLTDEPGSISTTPRAVAPAAAEEEHGWRIWNVFGRQEEVPADQAVRRQLSGKPSALLQREPRKPSATLLDAQTQLPKGPGDAIGEKPLSKGMPPPPEAAGAEQERGTWNMFGDEVEAPARPEMQGQISGRLGDVPGKHRFSKGMAALPKVAVGREPVAEDAVWGVWNMLSPRTEKPTSAPKSGSEAAVHLPAHKRLSNPAEEQASNDGEKRRTKSFPPQVKGPLPAPASAHAPDSAIAPPAAEGGWGLWDILSPQTNEPESISTTPPAVAPAASEEERGWTIWNVFGGQAEAPADSAVQTPPSGKSTAFRRRESGKPSATSRAEQMQLLTVPGGAKGEKPLRKSTAPLPESAREKQKKGIWNMFGEEVEAPARSETQGQLCGRLGDVPGKQQFSKGMATLPKVAVGGEAAAQNAGWGIWNMLSPGTEKPTSVPESASKADEQLPAHERLSNPAEESPRQDGERRRTGSFPQQTKDPLHTPTSAHDSESTMEPRAAEGGWGIRDMLSPRTDEPRSISKTPPAFAPASAEEKHGWTVWNVFGGQAEAPAESAVQTQLSGKATSRDKETQLLTGSSGARGKKMPSEGMSPLPETAGEEQGWGIWNMFGGDVEAATRPETQGQLPGGLGGVPVKQRFSIGTLPLSDARGKRPEEAGWGIWNMSSSRTKEPAPASTTVKPFADAPTSSVPPAASKEAEGWGLRNVFGVQADPSQIDVKARSQLSGQSGAFLKRQLTAASGGPLLEGQPHSTGKGGKPDLMNFTEATKNWLWGGAREEEQVNSTPGSLPAVLNVGLGVGSAQGNQSNHQREYAPPRRALSGCSLTHRMDADQGISGVVGAWKRYPQGPLTRVQVATHPAAALARKSAPLESAQQLTKHTLIADLEKRVEKQAEDRFALQRTISLNRSIKAEENLEAHATRPQPLAPRPLFENGAPLDTASTTASLLSIKSPPFAQSQTQQHASPALPCREDQESGARMALEERLKPWWLKQEIERTPEGLELERRWNLRRPIAAKEEQVAPGSQENV